MARRASSSTNPTIIIGIVVAAVILVIIGKLILGGTSKTIATRPILDVEELLENGNSLRGNKYSITGTVDEKLRWNSGSGRVVSLLVDSDKGEQPIPIIIPDKFKRINIERNQRYSFEIEFKKGGVPIAIAVTAL